MYRILCGKLSDFDGVTYSLYYGNNKYCVCADGAGRVGFNRRMAADDWEDVLHLRPDVRRICQEVLQ